MRKILWCALCLLIFSVKMDAAWADLPLPATPEREAYKQRIASIKTIYLCRLETRSQRELIEKIDAYMHIAPGYFDLADREIQQELELFFDDYAAANKRKLSFQVLCPDEKFELMDTATISYDYDATPTKYKNVPVLLGSVRFSVVVHSSQHGGSDVWSADLNPESFFISEKLSDEKSADSGRWPENLQGVVREPVKAEKLTPSFSEAISDVLADIKNIWTISF